MSEVPPYPEPEAGDKIRGVVEAGVAAVPVVGSTVNELMEVVFTPALDKRRIAWGHAMTEVVNELASHQVTPEVLAADEEWISAVFEATRIGIGTHIEAKLKMLKAVLTRMAIEQPRDSEAVIVRRFLQYVDELDEEHFLALQYAADPGRWFENHQLERPNLMSAARYTILEAAQVGIDGHALKLVIDDLDTRGLVTAGNLNGSVTANALYAPFVTPLGEELLAWTAEFE